MSQRDLKGFYARLGVSPDASSEDIRKAYRSRAMELHPDRNQGRNATRQFQELQEAYSVLGDAETRAEYDAIGIGEEQDTARTSNKALDPILCSKCGCVSAQPRYVIFFEVKSYVFATHKSARQGIFCSACAAKEGLKASAITWIFGWWGIPWGPIYSLEALVKNLFGGTQPREHNARILAYQAAYFAYKGNKDLARAIARDALDLALKIETPKNSLRRRLGYDTDETAAKLVAQIKEMIHALDDGLPFKRLKTQWGFFNRNLAQQGAMVSVLVGVLVVWASVSQEPPRPYNLAPVPAPAAASTSDPWEVVGTSPRVVSPSDAIAWEDIPEPLPKSKLFKRYVKNRPGEPMPPLKITNKVGGPHCLLKLYDQDTGIPIVAVFVRSSESVEVKVPKGTYRVKIASGEKWYGEKALFGPDTDYAVFDTPMTFEVRGDQLMGKSLELTPVLHGNLKRTKISAAEF